MRLCRQGRFETVLLFSESVTLMKEEMTLNNKEQKRLPVLNEVLASRITVQQAAGK
jgi:hypothetical protein